MKEDGKYDFTLAQRVELMRIDRMKEDTVGVMRRANEWANGYGMVY